MNTYRWKYKAERRLFRNHPLQSQARLDTARHEANLQLCRLREAGLHLATRWTPFARTASPVNTQHHPP
eukprot:2792469-Alexandrium_andersonii.AAC.1